jgi:hypothetical protein
MRQCKVRITQTFDPGPSFHYKMIVGEVWRAEEVDYYKGKGMRIYHQGLDCSVPEGCYVEVPTDN